MLGQPASLGLEGAARLGDGRLTARLDLRRLDGDGTATIDLALDPPRDRLAATVTLREAPGGLGATLLGFPDHPLALDLRLDGPAAAGAALTLTGALGPELGLEAGGTVRAGGDGALGAVLEGTARVAPLLPAEAAPLASPARFALDAAKPGDSQVVTLRRLALELPAGRLGIAGTLDIAREVPDLAVTAELAGAERFAGLLQPGLAFQGARATLRVAGTLGAPRLTVEAQPEGLATGIAQADAVLGPAPRLAGTAVLPGPVLDLALAGAAGRLAVQGSLAEPVDVTARLSLPDLAVLGAGSEGALEAEARATGRLADPVVTLTARSGRIEAAGRALEALDLAARIETPVSAPRVEARLTATLDREPIRLSVRGQPEGAQGFRLEEASLRIGEAIAQLTADGLLDTAAMVFAGTARLEARDLARLGRLGGVEGLAGRLTLSAELAPRNGAQGFDATLAAPLLGFGGTAVAGVAATVAGTPDALAWALSGSGGGDLPLGRFSGHGRVDAIEAARRVEVTALEAQVAGEALRLAGPARVTLGGDGGVEIAGLAVTGPQGARLAAQGRWGPERADLTATLAALPLSLAGRFVPDVAPTGTLSGQVRVTGTTARPEVRATLDGQRIASGAPWARGLPALGLRAEATLDAAGAAEARATIEAGPAGRLSATARLPRGFGAGATLAATVDGAVDVAPLAAPFLAGGADRVTGRVTLALRAEGPLAEPRPSGRITLSGLAYRNAALGVRVSDINGAIEAQGTPGQGTRLVLQDIRGRTAGGGSIALAGTLDPMAPGMPAALTLTARNARPLTSPYGTGAFNADLRLEGPVTAPGGTLRGSLAINGAEIRIPETLPSSTPVLTGVRTRGTLEVVARRLDLQRGTISFASGTLLPVLDLAAVSRTRTATVTVRVRGSPAAPEITFSSSPELPQDEVLSRLLFDRATSNLSPFEIAQLAQAVAQLTGVSTGPDVLDKLRGGLGLDRLGVTTDAQGRAAVEAGRTVAPGVFVGVRQGLQGQTGVGVQVELTPRLRLDAQTATGPAGDRVGLSYEIEY